MNTTGKFIQVSINGPLFKEVISLDHASFPRPWIEKNWLSIGDGFHHLMGVQVKGELAGFSLYHFLPGDAVAHLLKICLREDVRGSKITRDFWVGQIQYLAEKGINNIYLEVEASNLRAYGFYKKVGFKELRKISKYYSDGQDAVVMQLTL